MRDRAPYRQRSTLYPRSTMRSLQGRGGGILVRPCNNCANKSVFRGLKYLHSSCPFSFLLGAIFRFGGSFSPCSLNPISIPPFYIDSAKMGFKEFIKKRSGLRVDNRRTTSAATLTLRQSLWPLSLVTILFFLWVCKVAIIKISRRP